MAKIVFIGVDFFAKSFASRLALAGHDVSISFSGDVKTSDIADQVRFCEDYYLELQEADYIFLARSEAYELHDLLCEKECLLNAFQDRSIIIALFPYGDAYYQEWSERASLLLDEGFLNDRYIELLIANPQKSMMRWHALTQDYASLVEKIKFLDRPLRIDIEPSSDLYPKFLAEVLKSVSDIESTIMLNGKKGTLSARKKDIERLNYYFELLKMLSKNVINEDLSSKLMQNNLKKIAEMQEFLS